MRAGGFRLARYAVLFNSLEFVLFLPIVLVVHFLVIPRARWRWRKAFLVAASYGFYMSWNPFFGLLLLTSTLVDFFVAPRDRRGANAVATAAGCWRSAW